MLTNQHLFQELAEIERIAEDTKKKDAVMWAHLKLGILNLKLQQSIRTNMVRMMQHFKIDLVRPIRRDEKDTDA